jgi:hypothetical protein
MSHSYSCNRLHVVFDTVERNRRGDSISACCSRREQHILAQRFSAGEREVLT